MPAPEPGTRLSHYVIQKRIGGGGMGTVYRARDTTLDRDVAIKAINPGIAGDPDRIARFRREAKAVAALNHPGIVTIHEQLEEHGTTYLVTEFVEGTTLRELMTKERAVGYRQIADIGSQVAAGITHRDVKPDNIMITPGGRAKLLDDLHTSPEASGRVRALAKRIIERCTAGTDRAALVFTSGRRYAARQLTNDPSQLVDAVGSFVGQKPPSETVQRYGNITAMPAQAADDLRRRQALLALDTMTQVVDYAASFRSRRKSIVLVSEGTDALHERVGAALAYFSGLNTGKEDY